MQTDQDQTLAAQDCPALFLEINALISGWDASRPASDFIAALNHRLSQQSANTTTIKKRGK